MAGIVAVEDLAIKADHSEAVCKADWLARSSVTTVHLSHKHNKCFTLVDQQWLGIRTAARSAADVRHQ